MRASTMSNSSTVLPRSSTAASSSTRRNSSNIISTSILHPQPTRRTSTATTTTTTTTPTTPSASRMTSSSYLSLSLNLLDFVADKAAALFPEVEESSLYKRKEESKRRFDSFKDDDQDEEGEWDNKQTTTTAAAAAATEQEELLLARHRQYIYDRVSGRSYLPRTAEGLNDNDDHYDEDDNDADGDHNTAENRPPHYLCFVPPCVRRFPGFLEQNWFCETVGQIGYHRLFKNRHRMRKRIFFVGFVFNVCALILTIVGSFAATDKYNILIHISLTRGTIYVPNDNHNNTNASPVTIDIGFIAAAVHDPYNFFQATILKGHNHYVLTFAQFCDYNDPTPGSFDDDNSNENKAAGRLLADEFCMRCRNRSQAFVLSSFINMCMIIRNMFSDVLRMYPNYDLNCPNFYGSLMATLSVCLGIYTIFTYQKDCVSTLQQALHVEQRITTTTTTTTPVEIDLDNGPGLTCLIVATFLKLVDAICNFIVPTPSITRTMEEQRKYEAKYGRLRPNHHGRGYHSSALRTTAITTALSHIAEGDDSESENAIQSRQSNCSSNNNKSQHRNGYMDDSKQHSAGYCMARESACILAEDGDGCEHVAAADKATTRTECCTDSEDNKAVPPQPKLFATITATTTTTTTGGSSSHEDDESDQPTSYHHHAEEPAVTTDDMEIPDSLFSSCSPLPPISPQQPPGESNVSEQPNATHKTKDEEVGDNNHDQTNSNNNMEPILSMDRQSQPPPPPNPTLSKHDIAFDVEDQITTKTR